jgi:hypothetical protein
MSYIGQGLPADTFQGFVTDSFTGDGSATTFTLSKEPFSEDTLIVVINNVIQKPTTNFTVSGTTLTIVGTAVADGDVIYAIHMGGPLPIGESNKLDINGASDQLILDLDGDTTISADTDDQIDFKLGGSDIATLTTSSLTLKNSATADNSTFTLNLQTAESDIAADDVIGKIAFAAPSEGTGTDANLTAAAIQARSEGDFSSSSNATELQFMTGASEAATTKMTLTSTGALGLGTDAPARPLHIIGTDGTTSLSEGNSRTALFLDNAGATYINIASANNAIGGIFFSDSDANNRGAVKYNHSSDALTFNTSATEVASFHTDGIVFNEDAANQNFRIESTVNTHQFFVDADGGTCHIGTTSASPGISNTTDGIAFNQNGRLFVNAAANTFSQFATDGDGNILAFASAGTGEGQISISGTTVTYGAFTGTHWSRLADNSKPTILRGTLMESLDEMCDWYQAVADVAEVKYTAEDEEVKSGSKNVGDVKEPAYKKRVPITLPNGKAVGDAVTFTFQGETHTGVYEKEADIKHVKCKISDTADSKKIYGLFSHWDPGFDYLDDDVNDMSIAQVGTFIIRVNKDVTVEAGDLLVSNGDGTAKVQDDDIIRSKTVAKVNSNIKVETYSDGSYTVPCTLHC